MHTEMHWPVKKTAKGRNYQSNLRRLSCSSVSAVQVTQVNAFESSVKQDFKVYFRS